LVRETLADVTWADPANVKLPALSMDPANRHAAAFSAVPGTPADPSAPYLLAYELGVAPAEQVRADRLLVANAQNPTIVFAKSGAGKSRLLMTLLARTLGWLFVYRGPSSKNVGSQDMTAIKEAVERQIGTRKDEGGSVECRNIAVRGFKCLLVARAVVLDAWTRAKGKPTAEQWLWAQLHPQLLVPGQDIFRALAVKLFEREPLEFPTGLIEIVPEFDGYPVVYDEAQDLAKALAGTFETTQAKRSSRRSLLSPALEAVRACTSRGGAILAGTNLSMLEATRSTSSGVAAFGQDKLLFEDVPDFAAADVKRMLERLTNLDGESADDVKAACTWLSGRARFTTSFIEFFVAQPALGLKDALQRFVDMCAVEDKNTSSPRFALEKFRGDKRSNAIKYWDGEGAIVEARELWLKFSVSAMNEMFGARAASVRKSDQSALIEVGLSGLASGSLEPLVLETARQAFIDTRFVEDRIITVAGSDAAMQGKTFEYMLPFLECFGAQSKPLLDYALFSGRSMTVQRNKADSPVGPFEGVWRWWPAAYGKVALSEQVSGKSVFDWFHELVMECKQDTPPAIFPSNMAGPDFVAPALRWIEDGHGAMVASDPATKGNVALVVVQGKFGVNAALDESADTTVVEDLYRTVPSKHAARSAFIEELVEREIPVIRVVVSANSVLGTSCALVDSPRGGKDLLMVISGVEHIEEMFGKGWGKTVLKI